MASSSSYDLFLSYASEDTEIVRGLANHLSMFDLQVWYDENIVRPGDSIRYAIERGIRASRFIGLVLSSASIAKLQDRKGYLRLEEYIASVEQDLDNMVRIIPLLLGPDLNSRDLPPKYRDRQFVNITLPENYESGVARLVEFLDRGSRPQRLSNPRDGTELIHVPGGEYVWGPPGHEAPIQVRPFYIAKNMVSCSQYEAFLRDVSASPNPEDWSHELLPSQGATRFAHSDPAGGISFEAAQAYCEWAQLRLPTAFELEYLVIEGHSERLGISELDANSKLAEWSSTSGYDFGKGGKLDQKELRVAIWTAFDMSRNFQIPMPRKTATPEVVFRCAADDALAYSKRWMSIGPQT